MNTNENNNRTEDVIVLGVASIETLGGGVIATEILGNMPGAGISEE